MVNPLENSPVHKVERTSSGWTLIPIGSSDKDLTNFQPIALAALELPGYDAKSHLDGKMTDMVFLSISATP